MHRFAGGAGGKATTLYGCVAVMPYAYSLSACGTCAIEAAKKTG